MRVAPGLTVALIVVALLGSACNGATEAPHRTDAGSDGVTATDGWSLGADTKSDTAPTGSDIGERDINVADTGPGADTAMGTDTALGTDTNPPLSGGLCDGPCDNHEMCGGPYDLCLLNNQTGETFCSINCTSQAGCPSGFQCVGVSGIGQCVPSSGTCAGTTPPPTCDPACPGGQACVNGQCVEGGQWEAELQHCVDVINAYRAQHGRSQLQRSPMVEACAMEGAAEDASTGTPHGHFQRTSGCGGVAYAENEVPGWPLSMYGSVMAIVEAGAASMMDEGPGGGHYENILRTSHTAVGCGIFVTPQNEVWVVQDFR